MGTRKLVFQSANLLQIPPVAQFTWVTTNCLAFANRTGKVDMSFVEKNVYESKNVFFGSRDRLSLNWVFACCEDYIRMGSNRRGMAGSHVDQLGYSSRNSLSWLPGSKAREMKRG